MEQRHRDLPNNAHSVGLRSPRFIDQSLRSGEVVHDVASFSPVPVSATQGVVSMDIGGSPVPHSKAAINGSTYPYGYHDSDVPLYGDAPRTVAYSVNDSTMQLSDVSGEIAAAEERLAELEEKGSAAALNRGMYERRASGSVSYDHEGKKNGTAPPSRRDSYLSNGTLSPLNDQDSPPASRAPLIEPADIPQARFSLVAIQKKAAQNRPLVSVAVEVAEGVVEYVRLYEGDNYETCQKHALEMIEKHNLDLQAALETLTEHLCSTLDEYRSTNGPVPIAAAGQRPRDVTRDESVVNPAPRNQRSAAEPKKAAPSSVQRPQPSKSPNRREVQPSPMRSARTTTSVSSTVADRSAHPRDTSASRLRSLSARPGGRSRPPRRPSRTTTHRLLGLPQDICRLRLRDLRRPPRIMRTSPHLHPGPVPSHRAPPRRLLPLHTSACIKSSQKLMRSERSLFAQEMKWKPRIVSGLIQTTAFEDSRGITSLLTTRTPATACTTVRSANKSAMKKKRQKFNQNESLANWKGTAFTQLLTAMAWLGEVCPSGGAKTITTLFMLRLSTHLPPNATKYSLPPSESSKSAPSSPRQTRGPFPHELSGRRMK